jgi:hypothetical protein
MYINAFYVNDFLKEIDYSVARTPQDRKKVFDTVFKAYTRKGYLSKTKPADTFFGYSRQRQAKSFLASRKGRVLTTATVIPDSPLGLPMDTLYKKHLDKLRRGNNICEISMLASEPHGPATELPSPSPRDKWYLMLHLFDHILTYVKYSLKADYICIAIHPKYAKTYEALNFQPLAGFKAYRELNGAPAIAKYLDVRQTFTKLVCQCGILN